MSVRVKAGGFVALLVLVAMMVLVVSNSVRSGGAEAKPVPRLSGAEAQSKLDAPRTADGETEASGLSGEASPRPPRRPANQRIVVGENTAP
jgi:hypothetical protein